MSAPYKDIARELGFTPEQVTDRVLEYLELRKKEPTIDGMPECG
jgi:hypothetical protein